jgi:type II secretory pathway component GspD/PulD (secretin)
MSRFGSNLMQSAGLSKVATTSQTLTIIPETRLNALFVAGPPDQVRDVENVLKVLDAAELPEQLRDRAPRTIPVLHADASQVAEIVRNVYKTELEGEQPQGDRNNPIAMMFGGGRSSSGRGSNAREQIKMTLGVDTTTNQLIVSASDSLFKQVEALVQELDKAAMEARQTVRVVNVQTANAEAVQQALTTMIPKLTVSAGSGRSSSSRSSSGSRTSSSSGPTPPFFGGGPSPFGGGPSPFGGGGPSGDQIRQMILQRMQQGGGFPGRSSSGFTPGSRFGSSGGRSDGGRR